MKYLFLLKQQGYGCDYTIGCGKNWVEIEAETLENAINIFIEDEGIGYNGDRSLDYLKIVEVKDIHIWKEPEFLTEEEQEDWIDLGERVKKAEKEVKRVKEKNEKLLRTLATKKLKIAEFIKSVK